MRRSEGPLREMQERWGVPKGYTDHRELLDDPDIDAIDIITPTDSSQELRFRCNRVWSFGCCARNHWH